MVPDFNDKPKENPTIMIPDSLYFEVIEILDDIGMDLPTAIQIYLKKIAATRGIPFKIESQSPQAFDPEKKYSDMYSHRYGLEP